MTTNTGLHYQLTQKDIHKGRKLMERKTGVLTARVVQTVLLAILFCLLLCCVCLHRYEEQAVWMMFLTGCLLFCLWWIPALAGRRKDIFAAENGIDYQIVPTDGGLIVHEGSSVYHLNLQDCAFFENDAYFAIRYKNDKDFFIPKTVPAEQLQALRHLF